MSGILCYILKILIPALKNPYRSNLTQKLHQLEGGGSVNDGLKGSKLKKGII